MEKVGWIIYCKEKNKETIIGFLVFGAEGGT